MNVGRLWLTVAILLVAINLRPAMAALGPLLDLIEHATGLDATGAGLLTTLPVFLMGVFALLARFLRKTLGEVNGVTFGVVLISSPVLAARIGARLSVCWQVLRSLVSVLRWCRRCCLGL